MTGYEGVSRSDQGQGLVASPRWASTASWCKPRVSMPAIITWGCCAPYANTMLAQHSSGLTLGGMTKEWGRCLSPQAALRRSTAAMSLRDRSNLQYTGRDGVRPRALSHLRSEARESGERIWAGLTQQERLLRSLAFFAKHHHTCAACLNLLKTRLPPPLPSLTRRATHTASPTTGEGL
jgi:hypothetical protein